MTDEQLTISTLIAKATSLRRNERPGESYLLEKTAETLARINTDRDRLAQRLKWFETSGGVAAHTKVFALMAELDRLRDALKECEVEIDNYIDADYPPDAHPMYRKKNAMYKSQNPARLALEAKDD